MKSASATAAEVGIPVPAESAHLQAYTASTHAVVVLLCRWSLTGNKDRRVHARGMLHDIVSMVLWQDAHASAELLQMPHRPEGAPCTRPSGDTRYTCRHCAEIFMQVGRASGFDTAASQWHFQTTLLITLWAAIGTCCIIDIWFSRALHAICNAMYLAIASASVGQDTPEHIPQPGGASERLRLDPGLRRLACKTGVAKGRFRSAPGMARAGNIDVPPATARNMSAAFAADYYWTSFKVMQNWNQISLALDGSTVSGEDTVTFAAWQWEEQKCVWLVPQAHGRAHMRL